MSRITENQIEQFAIEILQFFGWDYVFGPDIAPGAENRNSLIVNRQSFEDVLLYDVFESALERINPQIPENAINDAIKIVRDLPTQYPNLIANNEAFHKILTEGIKVTYRKDGEERGDIVKLIDFDNPENNDFLVINQFTVVENSINKRPDIILFVNGLPLVVFELKNPADENATIKSAYNQIQTYKQTIPSLFTYNEIIIISDGLEAKAGSLSAGFDRFMAWKSIDGKREASHLTNQLEVLIKEHFVNTAIHPICKQWQQKPC